MGVIDARRRILLNTPHIVTPASAGLQMFQTDMIAPLKSCKVHFSPVQEGTGAPSPDNVRAISGWNGVKVFRAGKNLMSDNHVLVGAQFRNVDGNYEIATANIYSMLSIDVPKNTALHIHKEVATGSELGLGTEIAEYGLPVARIGSMTNYYNRDFSTGDYPYAYLMISKNTTIDDPDIQWQIEVGNAKTVYEAPKGTAEIAVDWTDEAGTVYGGWVDLVTGEVWAEQKCVNLLATGKSGTWDSTAGEGAFWYTSGIQRLKVLNDGVLSEKLVLQSNVTLKDKSNCITWFANGIIRWIELGTMEMTLAEYKAYLAENPLRVTYRLLEPELVATLTPAQLKTLKGANNIWSNANGDIDLSYWTH